MKKNACMRYRFNDKDFIERLSGAGDFPNKDNIVNYLRSGELFGQASVQNKTTGMREGVNIYTDGEWIWDNVLTEYVLLKNFKIGESFLHHMKNNNWKVPELDLDDPTIYDM